MIETLFAAPRIGLQTTGCLVGVVLLPENHQQADLLALLWRVREAWTSSSKKCCAIRESNSGHLDLVALATRYFTTKPIALHIMLDDLMYKTSFRWYNNAKMRFLCVKKRRDDPSWLRG